MHDDAGERPLAQDEWELTDADAHEAIRWAEDDAGDRTYSLWAALPNAQDKQDGVMLVRLAGWDAAGDDEGRLPHAAEVPSGSRRPVE